MKCLMVLLLNSFVATLPLNKETVNVALETSLVLDGRRIKNELKKYKGILRQLGLYRLTANEGIGGSEITAKKFNSDLHDIMKTYSYEKYIKFLSTFTMEMLHYLATDAQLYELLFDKKFKGSVNNFIGNLTSGDRSWIGFLQDVHGNYMKKLDEHFKKEESKLKSILSRFKEYGVSDDVDIRKTIREFIGVLADIDKNMKPENNFRSHLMRQVKKIGKNYLNESKHKYKSKLSEERSRNWRRNAKNEPEVSSNSTNKPITQSEQIESDVTGEKHEENLIVIDKDLEIAVRGQNL